MKIRQMKAKTPLPLAALALALGLGAFGVQAATEDWIRTLHASRPEVPADDASARRAPRLALLTTASDADAFAEDRKLAAAALPFALPDAAAWTRLDVPDPEYLSECDFTASDGTVSKFGVYGQRGCKTAYYWTGERAAGLAGGAAMSYAAATNFVATALTAAGSPVEVRGAGELLVKGEVAITTSEGAALASPFDRFWFVFADDHPGANWGHPCRYVFLSEDGTAFAVRYGLSRPWLKRTADGGDIWLKPGARARPPLSLEAVKNAVYSAVPNASTAFDQYYAGDVSHSYFVLISGGQYARNNGIRFWADTAMMYSTLTKKYGVAADHIQVFMSDGLQEDYWRCDLCKTFLSKEKPDYTYKCPGCGYAGYLQEVGKDACLGEDSSGQPIYVSSPTDLDGDGVVDVDEAANDEKIAEYFGSLTNRLTAQDQLFVFITSHGLPKGTAGESNYRCTAALYGTWLADSDLHNLSKDLPCPVAFAIETCYSGGFIDDLVATTNRMVATACNHYESSWGYAPSVSGVWTGDGIGKTAAHNCWAMPLISALRGYVPKSISGNAYPWQDGTACQTAADADGNGRVSFSEAVAYAKKNDDQACWRSTHTGSCGSVEHPQYGESESGLGANFYLLKPNQGASEPVDISRCTATVPTYTFTGAAITPQLTVTDAAAGGKALAAGTDYTLSGDTAKTAVGSYALTLTGKGGYTGTKTVAWQIASAAFDAAHTIVCYGDSLTFGEQSDPVTVDNRDNFFGGRLAGVKKEGCYPYWLSGMATNYNVVSQARGGMRTDMITAWRGGRTLKTKNAFTLTANREPLNTNLLFDGTDLGRLGSGTKPGRDLSKEYGGLLPPCLPLSEPYADSGAGDYGGTIAGTLGGYRVRVTGTRSTNICIQALGSLPAGGASIAAGTVFKPDAAELDPHKDAIHVFLAGANDGASVADTYLPEISATVALIPSGRYLVVSPSINTTSGSEWSQRYTKTTATAVEQKFATRFGDRYLNLRAELSKRGLDIAVANGWMTAAEKATAGTWEALQASDKAHFSTRGYKVVAYLVNEKLRQLGYVTEEPEDPPPHEPGKVTWSGAGADANWSTVGNWAEGYAPTAADWAQFPSGNDAPWDVVLDADATVADFYAPGSTTFSGGHALTAHVSGHLVPTYYVFARGTLTAAGAGTAVRVKAESMATLGGGTSLVAKDGAALSVEKLNFSDNGGMTLWADGADATVSFTLKAATTFTSGSQNTGISFKAADGGTLSQTNGYALTFGSGSKATLTADGGTLDMTKASVNCGDLTLNVASNGVVKLNTANMTGGAVNLTPGATWNATDAHLATAGNLTLGASVKYAVDVSALPVELAIVKLAVAQAGGTLSFTAPTAGVTLTGTGAAARTASLAQEGKFLYLTVTTTDAPVQAHIALDATATGGRTLANPVSYLTCWGGMSKADYPDFVDYAVLFTATGGSPARDLFVNPTDENTLDDYDFTRLVTMCRTVLDCGVKPYLKLGNVPVKFTKGCKWQGADGGAYQFNIRPPDDDRYAAYDAYMTALANALVAAFGRDEVRTWRFAVFTEANNPYWFQAKDGTAASTKAAFFKLYDHTAKAITDVLGDDIVFGTHLCESVANRTFTYSDFIAHCKNGDNAATGGKGAPLSLLDFSYYLWTPDNDNAAAGKVDFVAAVRQTLDSNGFGNAVISFDEGRVGETQTDGGGTKEKELITRAVGQSWQAAFDVRLAKSITEGGGEGFPSWGWFTGPDARSEGIPAISYYAARELAKFAGLRLLAPTVTANLGSSKEVVEALAAVDDAGSTVRIAACRFRDQLTFSTAARAQATVTLPAAMRGKKARLSVLTLDDTNNWFTDWIADRKTYGIDRTKFSSSLDDQSPLMVLSDASARALFATTLAPKYARKAAAIAPDETTLDVPTSGVVTVPIDFVGNSAVFVTIAADVPRPLRILAIGNSFSQQIVDLFPAAAKSVGEAMDFVSCYYGGCSLQQHWENLNGKGFYETLSVRFATPATDTENNPFVMTVGNLQTSRWSLADLLSALDWDVITVQQHSVKSPDASTYEPYLGNLVAKIRALAPNAKICFHQTWAYDRYAQAWGGDVARRDAMYDGIDAAVSQMAAKYGLDVIPSGYATQLYRYRKPVVRPEDDFCNGDHLHFAGGDAQTSMGRYLEALVFTGKLFGRVPSLADWPSANADAPLARQCAADACAAADYADYGQGTVDFRWNVVFKDADGTVLSPASVTNGAAAVAPSVEYLTGWTCGMPVGAESGVATQQVTKTSAEIAALPVYDHLTWTAQKKVPEPEPELYGYLDFGGSNSDSGSYFKTDYVPDLAKTKVVMRYALTDNDSQSSGLLAANGYTAGQTDLGTTLTASFLYSKGGARPKSIAYDYGGTVTNRQNLGTLSDYHTLVTDGATMTYDGVVTTAGDGTRKTGKASGPLVIGAMLWVVKDAPIYANYAKMRLQYVRIYEDGELVRDYIPAKVGTSVGLYDRVGETLLAPTTVNATPTVGGTFVDPEDPDPPHEPGKVTWSGAGTDANWSTAGNWAEGYAPTAADWTVFPSGNAEPWQVVLDADATVVDFFVGGATTFSGGHALAANVIGGDGHADKYYRLAARSLTVTGAGTALRVTANARAALSGGLTLKAADGAALSVDKLNFSDNGNITLWADGADSALAFTMNANTTVTSGSGNAGLEFKATAGGTLSQTNGYALTFGGGSKATLTADGGTLDMTKASVNCGDLTLNVVSNGVAKLNTVNMTGGAVNLTPDMDWNGTDAHLATAGNLTLGGSVAYTVDVSGWKGGAATLAVAKAGGTLAFTAPTAGVTLTGTGAGSYSAVLTAEGKTVFLTLTAVSPTVGGDPVEPAKVFEKARSHKPIVYPSAPTLTGEPGSQEIAFGGVTTKVPAHYTATAAGNVVTIALNDNAKPTIADGTGGEKGIELKDGTVKIHLVPAAAGLNYTLESATPLDGAWTPLAGPQTAADFAVPADGAARFYRILVTD